MAPIAAIRSGMDRPRRVPSSGALAEVRSLAGPRAVIRSVTRLEGGQHSDTWRVDTDAPQHSVVVREFPQGDQGAACEHLVLKTLDGLRGLAPVLLGGDLNATWSQHPSSLISWLDGQADITPTDPQRFAEELGHALAAVHDVPSAQVSELPSVYGGKGSPGLLDGPLATRVRSRWAQILSSSEVLIHCDYWSGNVVWRNGALVGIVDWSGAARGPRGYDLSWCRLDLVLLFDVCVADVFLRAYEDAAGTPVDDIALWDSWAIARSHNNVGTWVPNYAPLGRVDLDEGELRRRHSLWAARLLEQDG